MELLPHHKWKQAKKILCIRLDNMGDVLMCSPALRALKTTDTKRKVTLLASPAGARIAGFMPELNDIITFEAPWIKSGQADAGCFLNLADALKERAFDGAVIFNSYSQSPLPAALLCFLAGIPLRLAFCHENPYRLLTDWIPDPEPAAFIRHEVERQLALVSYLGAVTADTRMSLRLAPGDILKAWELLKKEGLPPGKPWVALHPGATAQARRYPSYLYAVVVNKLVKELKVKVVLTGNKQDAPLADEIREKSNVSFISLIGKTDIPTMAGVIRLAPLLISNNTASVHIAAAAETPVVVLYALTNLQHTPWQVPHKTLFYDTPCKLCYKSVCPMGHHDCLRNVSPNDVVSAARSFMKKEPPARVQAARNDVITRKGQGFQINLNGAWAGTAPGEAEGADLALVISPERKTKEIFIQTLVRFASLPVSAGITLIDDGSAAGMAETARIIFPEIKIVRPAGGKSLNYPSAIRSAAEPFAVICEENSWWETEALGRAVKILKEDPDIAVVTARVVCEPRGQMRGEDRTSGAHTGRFEITAAVFRRAALLKAGCLDKPALWQRAEGLFLKELTAAGWKVCYRPEIIVHRCLPETRRMPMAGQFRLLLNLIKRAPELPRFFARLFFSDFSYHDNTRH